MAADSEAHDRCAAEMHVDRYLAAMGEAQASCQAVREQLGTSSPEAFEEANGTPACRRVAGAIETYSDAARRAEACRLQTTKPVVWRLRLHRSASRWSRTRGELIGRLDAYGLHFTYAPRDGTGPQAFEPDQRDSQSGVPQALHTALAQRGEWVLLPRRPFGMPMWVHLAKDVWAPPTGIGATDPFSMLQPLRARTPLGETVDLAPGARLYLVDVNPQRMVRVFAEDPALLAACPREGDASAEVAPVPAYAPTAEYLIDWRSLFDQDLHLLIRNFPGPLCN